MPLLGFVLLGRSFVRGLLAGALGQLGGPKQLVIVPGAMHLFEEPGALEEVARLACEWFRRYLVPTGA